MYFRVSSKMEKPTLFCYFTRIVFIELHFTVAFLLIRKTWDDRFAGKMGGWGILRNRGNPSNGRVDTPLQNMTKCLLNCGKKRFSKKIVQAEVL